MKKTIRNLVLAAAFAASPPLAGMAIAGTATGTFTVSATVLNNCSITTNNLVFGNYSASTTTATTASTSLSVTCTNGLPYTLSLDGGTTTTHVAARAMTDGASHSLTYGLYTTNSYATVLGDGTNGTSTLGGTGNGTAQPLSVYGRIPASQFVNSGSYSDLITATVSY